MAFHFISETNIPYVVLIRFYRQKELERDGTSTFVLNVIRTSSNIHSSICVYVVRACVVLCMVCSYGVFD